LIETLVALAIFTTSITVLISVTGSGVANVNYAKNKFVASYLAQEGVEMVRNIRDNAWLTGGPTGWSTFLTSTTPGVLDCISATGCTIEPTTLQVAACSAPCPNLNYDTQGFYTAGSGTPTLFTRKIEIDDSLSADEIKVTSTVSWNQGAIPYSASYSESLLNWNQ